MVKNTRAFQALVGASIAVGCSACAPSTRVGEARVTRSGDAPVALVGATVVHPDTGLVERDVTVLLDGEHIAAIGPEASLPVPRDANTIDAHGKWIVPGYVDTHVHFFQSGNYFTRPDALDFTKIRPYPVEVERNRRALHRTFASWLASGVTSVVDMGGPFWNFDVRADAERTAAAPRVLTTGPLISMAARPALETAGDPPIIKVATEEEAVALAKRELAQKPDFLKVWFIYHPEKGDDLVAETRLVHRVAEEAHAAKLRLAVHATTLAVAKAALRAGGDMLVHSIADDDIDDEFISLARAAHATYTPTFAVNIAYGQVFARRWKPTPEEQRICDPSLLKDMSAIDAIPITELPQLMQSQIADPQSSDLPETSAHNLMRMWKEGFLVTVGTDAGNIGTMHGPSYFRELSLMAQAGLTPGEVLRAATSNGARFMQRENQVGDVRAGMIADLVVLDANPLESVKNMSAINRVVRRGHAFTVDELVHP